ncbi:MAG: LapA family protein [Spirulinaceae cyanobacterium]
MQSLLILAVIIAIVSVFFALQNPVTVTINFIIWQFQGPLALFLLLTLGAGVVVGFLFSVPAVVKRKLKTLGKNKRINELEDEMNAKQEKIFEQEKRIKYLEQTLQQKSNLTEEM